MRSFMLWIILGCSLAAVSQDKELTIQEAIGGYNLRPQNLYLAEWVPGTDVLSNLLIEPDGMYIQLISATDGVEQMRIGLQDINKALAAAKMDTLSRLPFPKWVNDKQYGFKHQDMFVSYNIYDGKMKKHFNMQESAQAVEYTKGYKGYAGTIDQGFAYEVGKAFGHVTSSTNGVEIGRTVHRSEFGIHDGLFFSPDGRRLAYYYKDEQMVSEYPLYDLSGTPASSKMIRYPTAGKSSHHVSLRIKQIGGTEEDVVVKVTGPKEQYLTNIAWTPDNNYVLIAVVNREQNHMWLNQYDAQTGDFVRTLFEETHEKYVEPEHPAQFLAHNPKQFIWWSERDGYDHLYLYNDDGSLVKQVTQGEWVVTAFHGFSADGKQCYITASKESPLERHLYCVDLASGKMKKLTKEAGYHRITPNEDNSLFLDSYSSNTVPRKVLVLNENGKIMNTLLEAKNPLVDYKPVEMELGSLTGPGGEELYYRMFKPSDFDESKQYPAVVYLYNGPHAQMVTNSWLGGANLWFNYMAQHGYVMFTIDGRGSANRGLKFENVIFRDAGALEMEDQLSGLKWLKSQSFVDSSRVGIHGWSYGGYMTISLMTRTPGNYKVGVAGGPVIDWELYEVMYTERYMDSPQENPEGFERTDLKNYVSQLEGDLLIIHGAQDNVVLWEHSLEYIQQAIKAGIQLDYFVYPQHEHNVIGKDRIHLYDKVSRYFFDKL